MDAESTRITPSDAVAADRRFEAAAAWPRRDARQARALLADCDPKVRAAAIGALVRLGDATHDEVEWAISDPDPLVRRRVCELASRLSGVDFARLLDDPVDSVVEAAAYALGEAGGAVATARLVQLAREHPDPLCREAAVAALGAIGEESGKSALLSALADVPAIRRRAVVALAAFDGGDVESALKERLSDRDWQTRQAAAAVLGTTESEPR
jgi:HEAT repeat protein